jgi:hypothetical protein
MAAWVKLPRCILSANPTGLVARRLKVFLIRPRRFDIFLGGIDSMLRVAAKWGFGDAPLKASHRDKTDAAIRVVLSILEHLPDSPTEEHLEAISHVKGQFTRTIKQDQWDWSTVWHLLGRPSRRFANGISQNLGALRTALKSYDRTAATGAISTLATLNIVKYLQLFLDRTSDEVSMTTTSSGAGYIYILSTRSLPTILKIGMTHGPVRDRAKEINSATGVIIPFGVRASWQVDDAKEAEREIHMLLDQHRVRGDREFFEIEFSEASRLINGYLRQRRLKRRKVLRPARGEDASPKS